MVDDGYEFSISGAAFHACGFIAGSWTMSLQLLKLLDVERFDNCPSFHAGRFFLQSVLILADCWSLDCLKSGNNPRELFLPTVSFLLSCWTKRTEARSRCCSGAGCFSASWVKENILDTRKGGFVIKVVRKWQHVKMTIILSYSFYQQDCPQSL